MAIANDVRYGSTGYIWTGDVGRAHCVSPRDLEAGMIWVNSENVRHLPTPFGGVEGIQASAATAATGRSNFYMETKNIAFATARIRSHASAEARPG